jgi:hypothetical protein
MMAIMPTKAELEQGLKQRTQQLETLKTEQKQAQRLLAVVLHALRMSTEDLDRALAPVTLCEETGSEQAERDAQELKRARERLEAVFQALLSKSTLNFLDETQATNAQRG